VRLGRRHSLAGRSRRQARRSIGEADETCGRILIDNVHDTLRGVSTTPAYVILALVALQRGAELMYASRNARALKERGGVEHGRTHYPAMVILHVSWLIAIGVGIARHPAIHGFPLVLFALLQAMRIWVLATLGRFWTTRIITLPDEPLVHRGPYRYFRHPNYLVVVGEMATLPLVFGQVANAAIFSVLNLGLLARRIKAEDAALAPP
jgi:methyltransferase